MLRFLWCAEALQDRAVKTAHYISRTTHNLSFVLYFACLRLDLCDVGDGDRAGVRVRAQGVRTTKECVRSACARCVRSIKCVVSVCVTVMVMATM